mmetsp:Transcript_7402/g.8995  ORF Transcript_7402/g.8995 Transcript_7402/m.8995 type:complete len:188 (-) Transcript_7402:115-678(-)
MLASILGVWAYHYVVSSSPVTGQSTCPEKRVVLALENMVRVKDSHEKACIEKTYGGLPIAKRSKIYPCLTCGRNFSHYHHLQAHGLTHVPKYNCTQCGEKFRKFRCYQVHVRVIHDKVLQCLLCGKSFSQTRSLKEHLDRHFNHKNFTCTRCNTSFRHRSTLIRHQQRPAACRKCRARNTSFGHLQK